MTEAQAIIGIRLLILLTKRKHLLIKRQGRFVLLQTEMALCISPAIERTLLRRKVLQQGDNRVKTPDGLLIIPFIIIAHAQVCLISRIQAIGLVEPFQKNLAFMIFHGNEIIQRPCQHFCIFFLLLLGRNRQRLILGLPPFCKRKNRNQGQCRCSYPHYPTPSCHFLLSVPQTHSSPHPVCRHGEIPGGRQAMR